MGHGGALLGPRPGSAASDDGSGPVTTRVVSYFSLHGIDIVMCSME